MLILIISAVLIGGILAVLFWPALWPPEAQDPLPPRPPRPVPPDHPGSPGVEGGPVDPTLEDDR